jgi:transposase
MSDDNEVKKAIAGVLNRHSIDADAGVPDFILAEVAYAAMKAFADQHRAANAWRGVPEWNPGQTVTITEMDSGLTRAEPAP